MARKITLMQLREELDLAKRDIRVLTGLVHILGVGTQFCLKDSTYGADYSYSSAVSALSPQGVLTAIPTKKPSFFAIPTLQSMWDAVFSTTGWKDL